VEIELLMHGTTAVLNAILTGGYPPTALITTAGFRDTLEIMRADRVNLFDIAQHKTAALVPRHLRFEIDERIGADGTVVRPLDPQQVESVAHAVAESGARAAAVSLIYGFLNPAHERAVAEALRRVAPDVRISTSHEVVPLFREYERTSTSVMNALALPLMSDYLDRLLAALRAAGFTGQFALMQSSGGVIDPRAARSRPVSTLFSGPAGGVVCAREVGAEAKLPNVINFDMGGTSCDVSAVTGGEPDRVTQLRVLGHPVQLASMDIVSVGAGGGSIAWCDPGGSLQVGPRSAGADPGPACYPFGGTLPTVTDASVVLGRYNPTAALGGTLAIDAERARRGLGTVARELGLSVEDAAWGILRLVNANMADAVREVSLERGRDPRDYALVAAGGAGPAHACEVGEELGIETVLVPPFPGVAAAQGMLLADVRHEHASTVYRDLTDLTADELDAAVAVLGARVMDDFEGGGVECESVREVITADMRYRNQTWELSVPVSRSALSPPALAAAFHDAYRARYGHAFDDSVVELINIRVATVGTVPGRELGMPTWTEFTESERAVYWGEGWGWLATPIVSRGHIARDGGATGPIIVEQADATIVVPPSGSVEPSDGGILKISTSASESHAAPSALEASRR
jgi:N-methylhydantoinase A